MQDNLEAPYIFREDREGWEKELKAIAKICWSHYNINVFCNCIILLRQLEFGPGNKRVHWQGESDQWVIPADCRAVVQGGMTQQMWLHAGSAWRRKEKTTSQPAALKQSQQTSLAGFSVSQKPASWGYILCLYVVLLSLRSHPPVYIFNYIQPSSLLDSKTGQSKAIT